MSSAKYLSTKFGHVIDGEMVIPSGSKMMDVVNPADEQKIAQVPIATKKELDQAVKAAATAQKSWGKKSWKERADILAKWGQYLLGCCLLYLYLRADRFNAFASYR